MTGMKCCRAWPAFLCALWIAAAGGLCAQLPAPSSSSRQNSSAGRKPVRADSALDPGAFGNGVYRNSAFAFTCKLPPAWVLRTDEMNADQGEGAGRVLFAAFSRPPQAKGEDVNSSLVIAAESAAAYPGLKDAAQYFGPLTEVAKAQGFDVVEEPYEFAVGSKTVVRGDFEKNVGSRAMHQSSLVMLARGYVVSFTFIGGTEDEVEDLIGNLALTAPAKR